MFPYKPGLDQSGTLLRALGAGVPAVTYDVGGLGENVRRFDAGRVVPAGDVDGLAAAIAELTGDEEALAAARAGAPAGPRRVDLGRRRGRSSRPLSGAARVIFGRRRFADAIARQLDLFEAENAALLRRIEEARALHREADRDDAEERYSEFLDLVELATDELAEMRDAFAAMLDEDAAEEYEAAFERAFRKRFPVLRAAG